RAAELHVHLPDRCQVEHGVEGRDFQGADMRHAEKIRDVADGGLGQPAADLLLRAPEQRNDRRLLAAIRILLQLFLRPGEIVLAEGEVLRLHAGRGKAAHAHRSTSPNTISIEPRMADTSASMWPLVRKSIALRWAKPGARI